MVKKKAGSFKTRKEVKMKKKKDEEEEESKKRKLKPKEDKGMLE